MTLVLQRMTEGGPSCRLSLKRKEEGLCEICYGCCMSRLSIQPTVVCIYTYTHHTHYTPHITPHTLHTHITPHTLHTHTHTTHITHTHTHTHTTHITHTRTHHIHNVVTTDGKPKVVTAGSSQRASWPREDQKWASRYTYQISRNKLCLLSFSPYTVKINVPFSFYCCTI